MYGKIVPVKWQDVKSIKEVLDQWLINNEPKKS